MEEKVIEIVNLTKKYGDFKAIDNINLEIMKGNIFGFIGANGAGKTTTLKIISGLIKKSSGEIKIFGKDWDLQHLKQIGSLIEYPNLYDKNSGYENLKIHALITNTPISKIKEILNIVGLDEVASKRLTGKYSLGMKQRLAIGISLLHSPDILILDEPTNGLDVEGIKEIRELIIKLGEMGKTIIISSHQLNEIEKACSHIGVIKKGKIVFSGTKQEFKNLGKKEDDLEEIYLNLVS